MKTPALHKLFLESTGISTDTRKIKKNNMFFALKGANYDANSFAGEALKKGASYVVIGEENLERDERYITVTNTLSTLQELASYHREHLKIPIIALTGSNGKTTTKELIRGVLSKKFNTVATSGNLNNHIGVPLTLLSMNYHSEIGIVEMGANHKGEIRALCEIAKPDFGYITNFGKAHLEGFGSAQGVIEGKKELYDYLKKHDKMLFLNLDDPYQEEELKATKAYTFCSSGEADVRVEYFKEASFAGIKVEHNHIVGNLTGAYNCTNMAAAYTIGKYFQVPEENILSALKEYTPQNNRSQIILKDNRRIIMDAYNANPSSMRGALENLDDMEGSPKIAILGDMFELGTTSNLEHEELAQAFDAASVHKIYLIGENFYSTQIESDKICKYQTFEDFRENFRPSDFNAGTILIKGSRGMALERVLELL